MHKKFRFCSMLSLLVRLMVVLPSMVVSPKAASLVDLSSVVIGKIGLAGSNMTGSTTCFPSFLTDLFLPCVLPVPLNIKGSRLCTL